LKIIQVKDKKNQFPDLFCVLMEKKGRVFRNKVKQWRDIIWTSLMPNKKICSRTAKEERCIARYLGFYLQNTITPSTSFPTKLCELYTR